MVKMTVYVNTEVFCDIVNCLNNGVVFQGREVKEVSLQKNKKYPYEVHVPIEIIGQFVKKKKTTIDIGRLNQMKATSREKI